MAESRVFVPPPRSSPSSKVDGRQRLGQLSNGLGETPSSPLSSGKTARPSALAQAASTAAVEADVAMSESDEDECKPPLHGTWTVPCAFAD